MARDSICLGNETREIAKDIPAFMDKLFGRGNWQYDEAESLYIARDPKHSGPDLASLRFDPTAAISQASVPTTPFNDHGKRQKAPCG
ncbi:hypothetical protein [Trinickia sp. EG282A]|uniref:hypothetical protein n=1 Tax=Trinickia sp. EG282A TaxID=3237013 RepID=UPI0034D1D554